MSELVKILVPNEAMLEKLLTPKIMPMLTKMTMKVEREAKRLCPVATGNLRRSITHVVKGGFNPHGIVKATAFYAAFVEYGTRFHAPQPFLRPALRVLKEKL